jgi:hypothetical protein
MIVRTKEFVTGRCSVPDPLARSDLLVSPRGWGFAVDPQWRPIPCRGGTGGTMVLVHSRLARQPRLTWSRYVDNRQRFAQHTTQQLLATTCRGSSRNGCILAETINTVVSNMPSAHIRTVNARKHGTAQRVRQINRARAVALKGKNRFGAPHE